jgi:RNA polymerase sigma factor (sigma-70 family)
MKNDLNQNADQYADWRNDDTPPSLWDRVLVDDAAAWEKLLKVWTPCIFKFCLARGIQSANVADVVQMVMMRIFKYRDRFSAEGDGHRLKAWLLVIIKNTISDYLRRVKSKDRALGGSDAAGLIANYAEVLDSIESLGDDADCFDPGLWMAKTLEVIQEEVSPQTWEVFRLYKIENQTAKEVGEKFEMSAVAVRQRAFEVTKRIKREAEGIFDSDKLSLT